MAVHLTTQDLTQGSAGFFLRLDFTLAGFTGSYQSQTWRVDIIRPDGTAISKTSPIEFVDNSPKVSVWIDDFDLLQAGTYYYQVTLTTGGANVKSYVRSFHIGGSLPENLAYEVISSSMGYFPIFGSSGALLQSALHIDGNNDLAFNSGANFAGQVKLADEPFTSAWNGKLEAPTKNAIYDYLSTLSQYSDEQAQDAVASILSDSATIDFVYNDASNLLTANVIPSGLVLSSLSGDLAQSRITGLATSLAGKENAFGVGTTTQYLRGDKTWQTLNPTAVGLGNVPNVNTTNASNIISGTLPTSVLPAFTGDVTSPAGSSVSTIANAAVTLAKMASVPTGTIFYRKTAGSGAPELQTLATLKADLGISGTITGTNTGDQTITLTGAVTGSGTGTFATTIPNGSIDLLKLSATGTRDATTYLRGDNTWATIAAGGGTVGNAITGGGANRVLFEDASQNLATDVGFQYNNVNKRLTLGTYDASNTSKTYLNINSVGHTGPENTLAFYVSLYDGNTSVSKSTTGFLVDVLYNGSGTNHFVRGMQLFATSESPLAQIKVLDAWAYGGGSTTILGGISLGVTNYYTGTVQTMYGIETYLEIDGDVTVIEAHGLIVNVNSYSPTATYTTAYGIKLTDWTANIGTSYGIYADASIDRGVTAQYFIYSLSNSPSVFSGTVSVPDEAYSSSWNGNFTVPTKNAIYDKIESMATGGMAIGSGVTGGGVNRVLYEDASQNLATSSRFTFDGSTLSVQATDLAQTADIFQVKTYDGTPAIRVDDDGSVSLGRTAYDYANGKNTRGIDLYYTGGYDTGGLRLANISTGSVTRLHASYGGSLYITNDAGVAQGITLPFLASPYDGKLFQFGYGSLTWNPTGATDSFYSSFGINTLPSAIIHAVATTQQLRLGYDASNYWSSTTNTTGTTTFDAVGSTASFVFSDKVSVPDDAYDATGWNGNFEVPTKNAIRDKIESLGSSGGITLGSAVSGSNNLNRVLYTNASGNLATSNEFTFDGSTVGLPNGAYFTSTGGGTWLNMPTAGYSALGDGGAGANVWVGKAAGSGQFFSDAVAGDNVYRNTSGKLLFGNTSGNADFAIASSKVGVGNSSPSSKLHVISITEQLRLGYDASNYFSTTVDSGGIATQRAVGTNSKISYRATTYEWLKGSDGTLLGSLTAYGNGLGFTSNAHYNFASPSGYLFITNNLRVNSNNTLNPAIEVIATASQTADFQQWTASNGTTILARVKIDGNIVVPDQAYGAGWDGNFEVPTKNAVYDKIEAILLSGGYNDESAQDAVGTILLDTATIDLTYNDATPSITASVIDGSITLAKMANLAANSILGNNTGSSATPVALTATQVKTLLALTKADVGLSNVANVDQQNASNLTSGTVAVARLGTAGGTPSSTTFLRGDNTWQTISASTAWGSITGTLSSQTDLATALSGKEPSITAGTTGQYWRGDKSWQTLDKTAVGLANVDNTSDASKPVSTAQQTALNLKANLAGATFTGAVSVPVDAYGAGWNGSAEVPTKDAVYDKIEAILLAGGYNDEAAQDAVGTILVDTATIDLTYNDTTPSITASVIDGSITLTKMANMATGSLIYRKTAGAGVPEVQTLATLKTDLGLTGTNSGDQTITLTGNVTGSGTGSFATTIAAGVVALAMMANVATGTVFYRKTAGTGSPEVQTLATLKTDLGLTGTNSGDQTITLTGDVTGSGTGSFVTAIGANKVTLGMMATLAANSIIGNNTGVAATPIALTAAQVKTLLALVKADVGLGNVANVDQTNAANITSGTLPIGRLGATGTPSATTFLRGDNSWVTISSTGSNTGDVSLAGQNYLSLAGQVITANAVDLSGTHVTGTLAAARFPALTGNVTTTAGSLATTIANNAVTLGMMAQVATGTFLGRTTAATGNVEAMTAAQAKTLLALTKADVGLGSVDNVSLLSWAGSTNITTLGTIATGSWNATTIPINKGGTGQTTAQAAIDALIPTQTGNSGKFLTTNGTTVSWATAAATYSIKRLSEYASIAAAITAIGATQTHLVIDTPMTTTASATFPVTTVISFEGTGKITIGSGHTLTVNLMVDPGNRQVFVQTDATANIRFGNGAVERMNVAWLAGTNGGTVTNAINQYIASATANGSGTLYFPRGMWLTTGGHSLTNSITFEGDGMAAPSTGLGSCIRLTTGSANLFVIGSGVYYSKFRKLVMDGQNQANTNAIICNGNVAAGVSANVWVEKCMVYGFTTGIRVQGATASWQMAAINVDAASVFQNNAHSAFRCNSINSALNWDANIYSPVNGYGIYLENSGSVTIRGTEFAGTPYIGSEQVESQTITGSVTTAGYMMCVVTAAGMVGSPATVYVNLDTTMTTAASVATAFRKALDADPSVTSFFHVAGTGADIELITIDYAANDATMNFSIGAGTAAGVGTSATSTNVKAGVAQGAQAMAALYVGGAHGPISFIGTQDEGYQYSVINDASDINSGITFFGSLAQAKIALNQTCKLTAVGSTFYNKIVRDSMNSLSQFIAIGTTALTAQTGSDGITRTLYPNLTNFSPLVGNSAFVQQSGGGVGEGTNFAQAVKVYKTASSFYDDKPSLTVLTRAGFYDPPALRIGTADSNGSSVAHYDIKRIVSGGNLGYLSITGSQGSPYSGLVVNGPIVTTDEAYGAGWDGNLQVPTKNAVYDKIQSLGSGPSLSAENTWTAGQNFTTVWGSSHLPYSGDGNIYLSSANIIFRSEGNVERGRIDSVGINLREKPRYSAVASPTTLTPDVNTYNMVVVYALANAMTIAAPTGTMTGHGERLTFRITDNNTGRALTWNAAYRPIGTTLPTTTTASKTIYVECIYNGESGTWDVINVKIQA